MKTSTGRCRPCAMLLARKTLFYTGEIPLQEHRIIRAGVLQEIPIETIINILRQQDKQGQYTEAVYQTWIQTIKGYQRHELLNNRFWDRKDVPWLSKRKRDDATGEDQASCLCPPVPKGVRLGAFPVEVNEEDQSPVATVNKRSDVNSQAGNLYFTMKDYAYWAPIARRAKKSIETLLELWDYFIFPMLELPKDCQRTVHTIDPKKVHASLRGLACAILPHYYCEWYDQQMNSSLQYWLYSTLYRLSINRLQNSTVPILNTIIGLKGKYTQYVE